MPDNDSMALGSEALKAYFDFMKTQLLESIYPVGTIYTSVQNVSPASFLGGTWEALNEGRVLIGAGTAHPAGETGGEETHSLSTAEMPSHNHSASTASAGSHSHSGSISGTTGSGGSHSHSISGSISSSGSHSHDRGTMNITGLGSSVYTQSSNKGMSGAFYVASNSTGSGNTTGGGGSGTYRDGFDASRNWAGNTGSNGSHTHSLSSISAGTAGSHTHSLSGTTITTGSGGSHSHSVTVGSAGSGTAHNNMQPYLSVYMWKRTA